MSLPSNESDKKVEKLVDHIFRHQSGRLVSTLTRIFGTARLDLAEEIVQDTLLKALQQWSFGGIPENPVASTSSKKSSVGFIKTGNFISV